MPVNELEVSRAGHAENALEDGYNRILINLVPVIIDLFGNVFHEVLAGHIVGEIILTPRVSTAHHNTGMQIGFRAGGRDIGSAIIVHGRRTGNQALEGSRQVVTAHLIPHGLRQFGTGTNGTGLQQFREPGVGNPFHILLEHFSIKMLRVKNTSHFSNILSLSGMVVSEISCQS